jgi:hypothetical protein
MSRCPLRVNMAWAWFSLPKEHASRLACEQEMERAIKAEGQVLLGMARRAGEPRYAHVTHCACKRAHIASSIHWPWQRRDCARCAGTQVVRDSQNSQCQYSKLEFETQQRILRAQHVQPYGRL